jgi:hypothetical protein
MTSVMKHITSGASYYGETDACGELSCVRRVGAVACGSGDDHVLTATELWLVQNHDPDAGDLILPDGPLNTKRPKGPRRPRAVPADGTS